MTAPKLESVGFGWLIANGQRYEDDVNITVEGAITLRPKHLSKKYGGLHTVLGPEEVECALVGNPEILLVGRGHFGVLPIRPETHALLKQRGVRLELTRIREAIARHGELTGAGKHVAAVLHLSC
jgi:hypothetical protein